jgi:hypothetical protein
MALPLVRICVNAPAPAPAPAPTAAPFPCPAIAHTVQSCAQRGVPRLIYSKFTYGKKQHDTVTVFKERNGFQRVELPRYYVPLTRAGWLGFQLGLHHRMADRLPQPLVTTLRELRSAWYNRKLHFAMKVPYDCREQFPASGIRSSAARQT